MNLTARFGVPVTTTCTWVLVFPASCRATFSDGTAIPIEVASAPGAWDWRLPGRVPLPWIS